MLANVYVTPPLVIHVNPLCRFMTIVVRVYTTLIHTCHHLESNLNTVTHHLLLGHRIDQGAQQIMLYWHDLMTRIQNHEQMYQTIPSIRFRYCINPVRTRFYAQVLRLTYRVDLLLLARIHHHHKHGHYRNDDYFCSP